MLKIFKSHDFINNVFCGNYSFRENGFYSCKMMSSIFQRFWPVVRCIVTENNKWWWCKSHKKHHYSEICIICPHDREMVNTLHYTGQNGSERTRNICTSHLWQYLIENYFLNQLCCKFLFDSKKISPLLRLGRLYFNSLEI